MTSAALRRDAFRMDVESIRSTSSAIVVASSCAQTRKTVHPTSSSARVLRTSRRRFSSSFGIQYSAFVVGSVRCSGQPCQKQPSINTATRNRGKAISGRMGLPMSGLMGKSTRNLRPRACSSDRTARSGAVSRRRFARMIRLRASGTAAQGSLARFTPVRMKVWVS
jgi:hypothetical protein